MDNSKLDDNGTSLDALHVDHTLLDIELVSDSDEAPANFENLPRKAGIGPNSLRIFYIFYVHPILLREPPDGPDRLDATDSRSPLT